jgi:Tfp pilus assembly protein PilV
MRHAHDSRNADSNHDVTLASSREQPTARSGPTSPGNAADARLAATGSSDTRSGLTPQEQSDRWPLG